MWHEILYDSIAEAGPEKYRIHCMQRSKVISKTTSIGRHRQVTCTLHRGSCAHPLEIMADSAGFSAVMLV